LDVLPFGVAPKNPPHPKYRLQLVIHILERGSLERQNIEMQHSYFAKKLQYIKLNTIGTHHVFVKDRKTRKNKICTFLRIGSKNLLGLQLVLVLGVSFSFSYPTHHKDHGGDRAHAAVLRGTGNGSLVTRFSNTRLTIYGFSMFHVLFTCCNSYVFFVQRHESGF
jgi:hypothetical protein